MGIRYQKLIYFLNLANIFNGMNLGRKIIICLLLLPCFANAQEWEFGLNLGAMGYIGDLNPNNPIKFTNPAFAANVRYGFTPFHGLKLGYTHGAVKADDANSNIQFNKQRNLNFRSPIRELALTYEHYFYPFFPGSEDLRFTAYVFVGLAGFQFEPETTFNGQIVQLRELGTEGQGSALNSNGKYSNISMAIPFGIGFKYNFIDNFNIGIELGYRNTFTDYLDDVSNTYVDVNQLAINNGQLAADLSDRSGEVNNGVKLGENFTQRGDASRRDFYMFTGLTISYTLTPVKCPAMR